MGMYDPVLYFRYAQSQKRKVSFPGLGHRKSLPPSQYGGMFIEGCSASYKPHYGWVGESPN